MQQIKNNQTISVMKINKHHRIGVFDSGVGGLTVVKELLNQIPNAPLIYFGDTARTPYGIKGPDTILRYSIENTKFLISKGATIIVVACNSASSVAPEKLREIFNIPVFEVISPAVELVVNITTKGRIGVIGTRATIESKIYEKMIHNYNKNFKVIGQPCPLLVPLVEEGWLKARETKMIVRKYLRPLKQQQIDTLILGCTHYPLLKDIIQQKIGKRVKVIDSSSEVAKKVKTYLKLNNIVFDNKERPLHQFYLSDISSVTKEIAIRFLGQKISIKKAISAL